MPPKNTGDFWNKLTQNNLFDADFIATRQIGLERFLHRCIAQPKLASDRFLFEFLTLENGWDKKIEATEYTKKSGKHFFVFTKLFYCLAFPLFLYELIGFSNDDF